MILEYHPEASAEAVAAEQWYADRSPTAWVAFQREFDVAIDRILQLPLAWPSGLFGTRYLIVDHFPYSLVYRIRADRIQILAVAHASRHPGYWRDRL